MRRKMKRITSENIESFTTLDTMCTNGGIKRGGKNVGSLETHRSNSLFIESIIDRIFRK